MKRKLLIIILMVGCIICLASCGKKKEKVEPKKDDNTQTGETINVLEPGVIEDKVYDDVTIRNIKFSFDGTYTTMAFEIENTTDNILILNGFDVEVLDKDGNLIGTFNGYHAKEIHSHIIVSLSLEIAMDFSKATTANFIFNNIIKK